MRIFEDRQEMRIYLISIAVHLVFLLYVIIAFGNSGLVMMGDSPDYRNLANGLIYHHTLVTVAVPDLIETTRLPGYPLFLSFFIFFNLPFVVASLFQILLVSWIPIMIMRIGKMAQLDSRVVFWAGLLTAVEPASVVYGVMLLPDGWTAFGFIMGFWALVSFFKNGSRRYLILSAIVFGLMNYIRPVGLFLAIALCACIVVYGIWNERQEIKKHVTNSAIFGLVFFIVLCPWMIRNYMYYKHFSFASGIERQLYEITAVGVRSAAEHVSSEQMLFTMRDEVTPLLPEPRDLASFKNSGILTRPALAIIFAHPVQYIRLYALSLVTFFASGNYHYIAQVFRLLSPSSAFPSFTMLYATQGLWATIKAAFSVVVHPYGALVIFGKLIWIALAVLTLTGMYLKRKDPAIRPILITFLFVCLYMVVVIAHLTVGIEARHRLFLNPFYYLFTAISLHAMMGIFKNVTTNPK